MLFEESFNIHNIVSFKITNQLTFGGFFKKLNLEYDFFKTKELISPDFTINVSPISPINSKKHKSIKNYIINKNLLYAKENKWDIQFKNIESNKTEITIYPKFNGFRNLFKYSAIKNLFVRPLISVRLLQKKCALIHSAGISIGNKGSLFVGRPGVFKTSIIIDMIRNYNLKFIGDENVIIKDKYLYSFPINIKSLVYKINHFETEKPKNKIQKAKLIKGILFNNQIENIYISEPCRISCVFFLEKSERFKVRKINLHNIIKNLIDNEREEIGISPTHMFSGIKYNNYNLYLDSYCSKFPESNLSNIWSNLENIINEAYKNASIYLVSIPKKYNINISNELRNIIINESL